MDNWASVLMNVITITKSVEMVLLLILDGLTLG